MTGPTPPPNASDELARLYLAGRDVPCPSCRYNRRDSDRAACPECGHPLELWPVSRATLRAGGVGAVWLLVSMVVFGAIGGGLTTLMVLAMLAFAPPDATGVIIALVFAGAFASCLGVGVGMLRTIARPIRRGVATDADARRLRGAGIVFIVAMTLVVGVPFLVTWLG